jgi:hypothetical protein
MLRRTALFAVCWSAVCLPLSEKPVDSQACCPAPPDNQIVLNADQTVLLIWDAAKKTQHFIRKANFKGKSADFGFIVPSPSQPELSESGDAAFPYLHELTKAETVYRHRPSSGLGCGCSGETKSSLSASGSANVARVLEQKDVAGFQAVVLEADTADALVAWLKENGFAYSPEIAGWARPYVEKRWKFTALKVAKKKELDEVDAAALRISFATDTPLFPYREPDYKSADKSLNPGGRTLRIFFVAEGRYQGDLSGSPWSGTVAWSDRLTPEQRRHLLEVLKLPETTGPAEWRLTEFVDRWPYQVAPADLVFSRAADQTVMHRPPIVVYTARSNSPVDATVVLLVALAAFPLCRRRSRSATTRREL